MIAWFESLTRIETVFAYMALPATLVLILQTVLMLFGLGDNDTDTDADTDVDGDGDFFGDGGVRLFTVRGLVAFFSITGWTGVVLLKGGLNTPLSIVVAILAGVSAMLIIAIAFRYISRLQSDGNIDVKNALGLSGTVYISVPPARREKGKVNIMLQGRYSEYDAVTDEEMPLPFGTEITVIGISGTNTLVIRKK